MREKSGDNQIDMFTGDTFTYRSLLTNDDQSTEKEVIEYYNQRGGSEKLFDVMNNDFGWMHLPCSLMKITKRGQKRGQICYPFICCGFKDRLKSPSGVRSVFALTGRYYNINYQHSSPLVLETASPTVTLNRYIAGLTLVKSGYYRSNMIYSFGKTEDIPTGNLARLITGFETSILGSRYYTGIKLLSGEKINRDRFIYSWFESGGYWSEGRFNDGIISLGFDYISGLYQFGSHRLRSFISLSYKAGINRISVGELKVNSTEFLKTYRHFREQGHQRFGIRAETVIFTPYYLLGFRFAAYSFIEAAMIAPPGKFALSGYVYPALGLGLRIRNENLVFSTFQLGLTWYGRPDIKGRYLMFEFTDIPQVGLEKFSIGAPEFTVYQ